MHISEVRVFPKEGQDKKLKAYATVTFDNCFVVRNIKVIQGANGLFIAMPSRKMKNRATIMTIAMVERMKFSFVIDLILLSIVCYIYRFS